MKKKNPDPQDILIYKPSKKLVEKLKNESEEKKISRNQLIIQILEKALFDEKNFLEKKGTNDTLIEMSNQVSALQNQIMELNIFIRELIRILAQSINEDE